MKTDSKTHAAIRAKLIPELSQFLGRDEAEFTQDALWVEDLGCDSLDTIEVVMLAEDIFHLSIDDESAEDLTTVGTLVNHIAEQLEAKRRGAA